MHSHTPVLAAVILLLCACRQNAPQTAATDREVVAVQTSVATDATAASRPAGWDEYWYAGLAELNSYRTTQRRYGEDREGSAVLIFVTEDFLPERQVKDDGAPADEQAVSVLKLNRVERFTTGVYDYSIMQSVFTPVSRDRHPHTLKTTLSVQDWCGHVWAQYNFRKNAYQVEYRSYFQAEGDQRVSHAAALLEDELPNLVRLDPAWIPDGEVLLIPSEKYGRLHHKSTEPRRATLRLHRGEDALTLGVEYRDLERSLSYEFDPDFPHRLERWTVTQDGQRDFEAERTATRREPYWQQNGNRFAPMRDSLGL